MHFRPERHLPLAACLVFAACSCRVQINTLTPENDPLAFEFRSEGVLCPGTPEIGYLQVTSVDSGGDIWYVSSNDGSHAPLDSLVWGQVPTGFSENHPAPPLAPGQHLKMVARGPSLYGELNWIVGDKTSDP